MAALATVSGPFRLDWEQLPSPVRDIMAARTGGADAAHEFVRQVDLAALAPASRPRCWSWTATRTSSPA
ncbi:hypothetical protein [Streptomyces sp. NPDC101166]|uniref:hypothetical protein n=1 Tax=Streptomyces sp. NPDC101166 TaxID=3366120 RepID=UPI0037F3B3D6